jgi:hypothetical protein
VLRLACEVMDRKTKELDTIELGYIWYDVFEFENYERVVRSGADATFARRRLEGGCCATNDHRATRQMYSALRQTLSFNNATEQRILGTIA